MDDLTDSTARVAAGSGFSGVVRVDRAGGTLLEQAHGLAHRGFEIPHEVDTQFAIASGGKAFTALAVVRLIEDGVLSWDTTARSVLGDDLPLIADDVTVEHLLAHRSGIGDYIDEDEGDPEPDDYLLRSPVHRLATTEPFLAEVDGFPTKFPAGERFAYCNSGFIVLALIAERASRTPYHDLVAEQVLRRAGLADTAFLRSDEPSGRMALGYLYAEGLRTNVLHLPVRGNGDGGIYTTAADLRRFWTAFLGGRIVSEMTAARMTRPRSDVPEDDARYGLGFWLNATGHAVVLEGMDAGVSFRSAHDPVTDTTWTVLANSSEGAWPLARHLRQSLGF
ncbi:serine hydrolase [Nocardioides sp.]|uniref:serine hydrolase domain-containing protein n=1 Tax=Nocardioides sp. TaxID=35761 RepID=UPI002732E208|nr:serine hydrolase domain-containing protein [Nocardioides sp.]MDP3889961.1 serine hydrolase domain-containing protein [Nocardioides sp.]